MYTVNKNSFVSAFDGNYLSPKDKVYNPKILFREFLQQFSININFSISYFVFIGGPPQTEQPSIPPTGIFNFYLFS